jgi:hypothetical protein
MRLFAAAAGKLSPQSRRLAVKLVNALKEHEGKAGKFCVLYESSPKAERHGFAEGQQRRKNVK